ncbi:CorA-like Mg2+ transporter protein [Rhizoctonia solani]|uniref:CorA-like Mg2+ transporter protein n=1 Tax=Rhizoctonia solani TaxID=456999 RepID=A0A8H7IJD6_9AGAM|nr:CorA-like Mg2+ transporter protein [Rhizoctonia solani]
METYSQRDMAFTLSPIQAPMELFPPSSSASPSAEASLFLSVPPNQNTPTPGDKFRSWSIRLNVLSRLLITRRTIAKRLGIVMRINSFAKAKRFPEPPEGPCTLDQRGWISWDVVKQLALQLNLHPLSVEDVMTDTQDKSFKIDYYQQHLFAQLTSFTIAREGARDIKAVARKVRENSSSGHYYPTAAGQRASQQTSFSTHKHSAANNPNIGYRCCDTLSGSANLSAGAELTMDEDAVQTLKLQSGTLDVDPARLFVFILKDGTLVTIHQSDTLYGSELTERLKNPAALMRIVADPSMLFHGHLDLIGDHLLTIVDEYQRMILELERSILLKPTLVAVQSCRPGYYIWRLNLSKESSTVLGGTTGQAVASPEETITTGFMCEESIVYLSDILDHVCFITLSLDSQTGITKELIEYTFNLRFEGRDENLVDSKRDISPTHVHCPVFW